MLLLRTPESSTYGIKWLRRYEALSGAAVNILGELRDKNTRLRKKLNKYNNIISFITGSLIDAVLNYLLLIVILFWILSIPISILIKILATSYCVLRRPLYSVRHIPMNWRQIALHTDLLRLPELVPGYESATESRSQQATWFSLRYSSAKAELYRIMTPSELFKTARYKSPIAKMILGIIIYPTLLVVIVVPFIIIFHFTSMFYRFSLKSSSIIYFPLIYISGGLSRVKNVDVELDKIRNGPIQKFGLYYAFVILVFFNLIPLAAYSAVIELRHGLESHYPLTTTPWFRDLVGYWLFLYEWKPLYVARAISAILTVALFFRADREIRDRKFGRGQPDQKVTVWLGALSIPRFICVVYTAAFGVYTLSPYISGIHLPLFSWDWWPA